jgi:cytochrome c1
MTVHSLAMFRGMLLLTALATCIGGCGGSEIKQNAMATVGGSPDRGAIAIDTYGCASCHTIPGIHGATATVGPPLTKMGLRSYVGGVLPNTPRNLVDWIQNPPGIDPKTAMPNLHVTESDARDIATYLFTLQ